MAKIYALSDIHGNIAALENALHEIFLTDFLPEDTIIFCGDYVDNGLNSAQVLEVMKKLERKYSGQIKILLGNHDEWFLSWIGGYSRDIKDYPAFDEMRTIKSFFTESEFQALFDEVDKDNGFNMVIFLELVRENMRNNKIVQWLKAKYPEPRYIEMEHAIYVHAGIDETLGELWDTELRDNNLFTHKYPATVGTFYKTIVAGHVYSDEVGYSRYFGKVFWDGASHFYIDGNTNKSGIVPVLKYDTTTQTYTSGELLVGIKREEK